jgi:hypothetical protein
VVLVLDASGYPAKYAVDKLELHGKDVNIVVTPTSTAELDHDAVLPTLKFQASDLEVCCLWFASLKPIHYGL